MIRRLKIHVTNFLRMNSKLGLDISRLWNLDSSNIPGKVMEVDEALGLVSHLYLSALACKRGCLIKSGPFPALSLEQIMLSIYPIFPSSLVAIGTKHT